MAKLTSAVARGDFWRGLFFQAKCGNGTLDVEHVIEEGFENRPGRDCAERADDHEYEPGLIIPFAAVIARDARLAAQAHLALKEVIHFGAVGVVAGDADEAVGRVHGFAGADWLVEGCAGALVSPLAAASLAARSASAF